MWLPEKLSLVLHLLASAIVPCYWILLKQHLLVEKDSFQIHNLTSTFFKSLGHFAWWGSFLSSLHFQGPPGLFACSTYKHVVDHSELWKILQEMEIPDHLTCLLRNLYAGQEATVRTGHETTDWFQVGKGVHQGCILSPCLFSLDAEYITWNAGLDEAQAEIKITGRNISNLIYADDTTFMAESEEEEPLDESERGEWKSWLKTQHSEN